MRKLIILLMINLATVFGQSDSLAFLRYYPLEIGNMWQYEDYFSLEGTSYCMQEIIGDTILPNGLKYFEFNRDLLFLHRKFERIDTSSQSVYAIQVTGEYLKFQFDTSDTQSFWTSDKELEYDTGFGNVGRLSILRPYQYFQYFWGLDPTEAKYSEGIGLSYFRTQCGGHWYFFTEYHLVAAKIGDSTYGQFVKTAPEGKITRDYQLLQNYPNPFNAATRIPYIIPARTGVKITVYDVRGNQVKVLYDGISDPGKYTLSWQPDHLKSGLYFIKMVSNDYCAVKKCALVK